MDDSTEAVMIFQDADAEEMVTDVEAMVTVVVEDVEVDDLIVLMAMNVVAVMNQTVEEVTILEMKEDEVDIGDEDEASAEVVADMKTVDPTVAALAEVVEAEEDLAVTEEDSAATEEDEEDLVPVKEEVHQNNNFETNLVSFDTAVVVVFGLFFFDFKTFSCHFT